jgi:hypothetical protein
MSSFNKSLALGALTLLAVAGSAPAALAQSNDLGLEAIVAPHVDRSFGEEQRTRFGLDFYRVSSRGSLLALYGTGANYNDYTLMFRIAGFKQFFGEPFSRGFIYGLGIGTSYSSGVPATLTATTEKVSFLDVLVNPYVRYLFDINGWVGPYLELGYQLTPMRASWPKDKALDPVSGKFILGFGIAIEAER